MASWPKLQTAQPFLYLEHQALVSPLGTAMVTAARSFTFRELFEYSSRIAGVLAARGVRPGDVVVTELDQDLNLLFVEALFHEAALGCTYPGIVEASNPTGFDWLVSYQNSPAFPTARTIIVDEAFMAEVAACTELRSPQLYESTDSVCRLVFSSGTTGGSIAVPYTIRECDGRSRLGERNWMTFRPFMSLIGIMSSIGFLTAYDAVASGETYFSPAGAPENLHTVRGHFVATVKGSPAQLGELAAAAVAEGVRLDDVAVFASVGSLPPLSLISALRSVSGARILNFYGSTECGTVAIGDAEAAAAGAVGLVVEGMEVEVVDGAGATLSSGTSGVIRTRHEFLSPAYFPPGLDQRDAIRDGWFYPGDLGVLTRDGHLLLEGRSAELINAGGVKIDPARIDSALLVLDGVVDGAVAALDIGAGAVGVGVALVVDDDFDLESVIAPVTASCQGVKPSAIVRVESIPRNAMGKVVRAATAAILQHEFSRNQIGW